MISHKIKRMYTLSFMFALHISISAYINSVFLTSIIKENYVGLLYTTASFVTIMLLSRSSIILKNFGNRKLILSFLIINAIALVGLITSNNPYIIGTSFILFTTTNTLVFFCIDIFIEHFGDPKTIGKTRGLYLTVLNTAWMMSPLLSVFLITREGGYRAIFTVSFFIISIMTIGVAFSTRGFKDKKYQRIPLIKAYNHLRQNRHILAIVVINFMLQFFYSWMVVYTPIYLFNHIGFAWSQIGIIFTFMLAPFVILGFPVGILIDKYKVSKRKLLYIGYSFMILSTITISLITTKEIVIWALVLFMTRVGATIIETTSETYFFSHVREEEAYLLSIFRDINPVAYIVSPLLASLIFIILPIRYLFVVLGVLLFIGVSYIPKLKHDHQTTEDMDVIPVQHEKNISN